MASKQPPMPPKKPSASAKPAPKPPAKPAARPAAPAGKMSDAQKYAALKKETQRAGMTVVERNGKISVMPKGK
jgi:hypothetical protein